MATPRNINEVQRLVGRVAALNRVVLRSIDKYLPFFKVLWKAQAWDCKCDQAFEISKPSKKYLTSQLLLSQPRCGETLTLYLVVSS